MILQPKTLYGQQILKKHGIEWVLIRKYDSYYSSKRPGPWGKIQPVEGSEFSERWIHLHDDQHFVIKRKL
jgi:ATP-dependent DNA ligase